MIGEVRCETCGQLMAVVLDNGFVECKIGRRVIRTERAVLSCLKCGNEIAIDTRNVNQNGGGVDKSKETG